MPDRAWFQRMARTTEGGLLGALREHYKGFEVVEKLEDFENGIEAETASALDLVTGLITSSEANTFIRVGYDFDNTLHAWKAARLGAVPTFNPYGLLEGEFVGRAIAGEEGEGLPPYLRIMLERIQSVEELSNAEYLGESAKWDFLLRSAPGGEAREFVRTRIDLINIKNFVRFKRSALRGQPPESVWIGGGELEGSRLAGLFKEPEEVFYSFLGTTGQRGLLRLGLGREIPLWKLEPILKLRLLDSLRESMYRFFDLSPVLYHLELRARDALLLRMIIVGMLNRLPEEHIIERVESLLPS